VLKRIEDFPILAVLITISALSGACIAEDWSSYSPEHDFGSGKSDWWTAYPSMNENSGASVEHPSWVLEALKKKPVLILVHTSTCVPCVAQIAGIKAALETYGDSVNYFDILAEGSSIIKAIEILDVYNPAGGAQYVPTTIFVTLIKNSDGEVQVGWHSAIDAMGNDVINGYLKDAIYYHQQNAALWG
jgi:hypothetical protein